MGSALVSDLSAWLGDTEFSRHRVRFSLPYGIARPLWPGSERQCQYRPDAAGNPERIRQAQLLSKRTKLESNSFPSGSGYSAAAPADRHRPADAEHLPASLHVLPEKGMKTICSFMKFQTGNRDISLENFLCVKLFR